jgi:hypothetical protein
MMGSTSAGDGPPGFKRPTAGYPGPMLLRFEGGLCDGREEASNGAPDRLILRPDVEDFLHGLDRQTLDAISYRFEAAYRLTHLDRELGIAIYEPLE